MAHGETGYEMYALAPWRLETWDDGFFMGVGMFYADGEPDGKVISFCFFFLMLPHTIRCIVS